MARGTLVGEAFIRVHADNTSFAAEVAHGMHGFKQDAGDAGDEAGDEWGKRFFESLKSELEGKMAREFKQGFLTGDFSNFAHSMGDVDTAIAHINSELQTMHDEGGLLDEDFTDLSNVVERFAAGVRDAEEHADFSRRGKGMESYAASLTKASNEMGHFRDASGDTSISLDDIDNHLASNRRGVDNYAASLTKAAESMGHFRQGTTATSIGLRDLEKHLSVGQDFEKLADQMTRVAHAMDFQRDSTNRTSITWKEMQKVIKNAEGGLGSFGTGLRRLGNEHDTLAKRIRNVDVGKIFGKGSRNDFINIVGAVIGGISKVTQGMADLAINGIELVGKGLGKLGDAVFGGLIDRMSESGGAFSKLSSTLGTGLAGIGAAAGPVVAVLITVATVSGAVTIGLGVLGEALGVVTSALSLAAAGVIAVAGALETALIGALVVATPLVFVFAAQIGVLVTAFAKMTDEQKKLLQPMKDLFKVLQTKVQAELFKDLANQVKGVGGLIENFLQPLLVGVASTLRQTFTTLLTTLNSASFKPFLTALTDATTRISASLGDALATALPGILAFFKPILPLTEELAKSIDSVAHTFTDWATSAGGQNEIANFFNEAWSEAKVLWQILVNASGALQALLSAGNAVVGKTFLGWLEEKTRALKDFLNSPEGQNKLADWFHEAQKFGNLLWGALEKVGSALASLDTAANREIASKLVIGFGRLFDIIQQLGPMFEVTGKILGFVFAGISKILGGILITTSQVSTAMSGFFRLLGEHVPGMQWAVDVANDLDRVSESTEAAGKALVGLPDQIQIDFDANDTDLILAAQKAAGIVDTQDGSTATTQFGGNTDPLKQAVTDANKIIEGPPGAPKGVNVPFNGDLGPLIADAAGATDLIKNFEQANVITAKFDGDTLPLIDDVNKANKIIQHVKPTYDTEFGGDTSLLMEATVDGNDIIDSVYPEWLDHTSSATPEPLETARIQATGELLDVPIDWTTFFMRRRQPTDQGPGPGQRPDHPGAGGLRHLVRWRHRHADGRHGRCQPGDRDGLPRLGDRLRGRHRGAARLHRCGQPLHRQRRRPSTHRVRRRHRRAVRLDHPRRTATSAMSRTST